PFVYFDYRSYSTAPANDQPSAAAQFSNGAFGGIAQPYALDVNNNKVLDTGSSGGDSWANADSFQIVSAGQDGNFGTNVGPKLYPAGIIGTDPTNYTMEDNDNNSNFCDRSSLEDARP